MHVSSLLFPFRPLRHLTTEKDAVRGRTCSDDGKGKKMQLGGRTCDDGLARTGVCSKGRQDAGMDTARDSEKDAGVEEGERWAGEELPGGGGEY